MSILDKSVLYTKHFILIRLYLNHTIIYVHIYFNVSMHDNIDLVNK